MFERIDVIGALRRGWRLLLALAVIGIVAALVIPVSTPKAKGPDQKYHWKTSAVVGVEPAGGIGTAGVNGSTILFWANNYYTRAAAAYQAGYGAEYGTLSTLMTAAQISLSTTAKGKASSKNLNQSSVVELTSDGTTKAGSAKVTNEFAVQVGDALNKAFNAHQTTVPRASNAAKPASGYLILVPAVASKATRVNSSKASITSSKKVRGLAGLVIGLLLGAAIVLVRELTDRTIHSAGGAEAATHYPVILEIRAPEAGDGPSMLAVTEEPRSTTAEGYRMLRMSVLFEELAASQPPPDPYGYAPAPWETASNGNGTYAKPDPGSRQVVLVVSPAKEGTRPIVAVNLCATYAEAGQRAIVISTDDVDSGMALLDGSPCSGVLRPEDVAAYLEPSSLPNVSRLSFRHFVSNSGQLVTRAPEVIAAARQLADVIIVESPPFLESHHGEALVHAVDVVLLVIETRRTTLDHGKRTGNLLRRIGSPVLGVILTNVGGSRTQDRGPAESVPPATSATGSQVGEPVPIPEATKS